MRAWPIVGIVLALSAGAGSAQNLRGSAPQLQKLLDCKTIPDPTERLACYDRNVAALDESVQRKDVIVAERQQVRQARRSLFGLSLPKIDLFGSDEASDAIDQIEGHVTAAHEGGQGWRITLDDGSIWQQTDDRQLFRAPKPGETVTVKRGALGSYFLTIPGLPGLKVRRVI